VRALLARFRAWRRYRLALAASEEEIWGKGYRISPPTAARLRDEAREDAEAGR
jgi:hypothetical protein